MIQFFQLPIPAALPVPFFIAHVSQCLVYLVTGGSEEMASATLSITSLSTVPGTWIEWPGNL